MLTLKLIDGSLVLRKKLLDVREKYERLGS